MEIKNYNYSVWKHSSENIEPVATGAPPAVAGLSGITVARKNEVLDP